MYFKRDIENDILKWYNLDEGNVLRISGARHVGKTTTIMHFVNEHYKNIIVLDLLHDNTGWVRDIVSYQTKNQWARIDPIRFGEYMRQHFVFTNDKDTVIFIKNIQCDHWIYNNMIHFSRDLSCDVIVSMNYFGRDGGYYKTSISELKTLELSIISFCEFLRIVDDCVYRAMMQWPQEEIDDSLFIKIKQWFSIYTKIGGYPEAIEAFLKNEDTTKVIDNIFDLSFKDAKVNGKLNVFKNYATAISIDNKIRSHKHKLYLFSGWRMLTTSYSYDLPSLFYNFYYGRTYFRDLGMLNVLSHGKSNLTAKTFLNNAMIIGDFERKFRGILPGIGRYNDEEFGFAASCFADDLTYAFCTEITDLSRRLIEDRIADKVVYFTEDYKHVINDNVESVPLCLAERWFSEVKYKDYGGADPSLFKINFHDFK